MGTQSFISDVRVTNNVAITNTWQGAFVGMQSRLTLTNSVFSGNNRLETGVSASDFGVASLRSVQFTSNTGTTPNVSALAFAISNSQIDVQSVDFTNNLNYTVSICHEVSSLLSSHSLSVSQWFLESSAAL